MHSKLVCSICLDDMFKDKAIVSLPCGHIFGQSCIEECIKSGLSRKCALCNERYRAAQVHQVYIQLEDDAYCFKEQCNELTKKTLSLNQHCQMMSKLCKMVAGHAVLVNDANLVVNDIMKDVEDILDKDAKAEPKKAAAVEPKSSKPGLFRHIFKMK